MKLSADILKKILVSSGFISESDFEAALKTAAELDKNVSDILIFRGFINEDTLGKLTAEYYKVPAKQWLF